MPSGQASEHFVWEQFACPCRRCSGFPIDLEGLKATIQDAEAILTALDGEPLLILRGWLCEAAVLECEEAEAEAHAESQGFDFVTEKISPGNIQRTLKRKLERGLLRVSIGGKDGYTHVERPLTEAPRWWRG